MNREGGKVTGNMVEELTTDKLENGVLMVSRNLPSLRTVTMGIGVNVGSINEDQGHSGISHFIEHAVFKGTENFGSYDLKRTIESYGGILNAFTSKEYTLFHAKVPDFAAEQAFDVLHELTVRPLFPKEEVESEKGVVIEEISMYEDDPGDLAETNLLKALWGDTPYGRTIIGTTETVSDFGIDYIRDYFKNNYVSSRFVVAFVGNIESIDMGYVKNKMSTVNFGESEELSIEFPQKRSGNMVVEKQDLRQVNVSLGIPTVEKSNVKNYALSLMATVLGSGMSSILFERVREKLGLVYSIFASNRPYRFGGDFSIGFSTTPKNVIKALDEIKDVLKNFKNEVGSHLDYGKKRLEGRLLMSTESTLSTMYTIFDDQFTLKRIRGIDEMVRAVKEVNEDDVRKVFDEFLKGRWTISAVGPAGTESILKDYEFAVDDDGR